MWIFKKTKKKQKYRKNRHVLLSTILVAASALVVVYFMPRYNSFNYSYELGQPWRYGTLISSKKFNIEMSDSALLHKQDSIAQAFEPYFNYVEKTGIPFDMLIMGLGDLDSLQLTGTKYIKVVKGNMAQRVEFNDDNIWSVKRATLELGELSGEAVVPTLVYDRDKSFSVLSQELNSLGSLGYVAANEKIVDRGEIITEEIFQKLRSYENVMRGESIDGKQQLSNYIILAGQVLLVVFICSLLVHYLSVYREDYLSRPLNAIMAFVLMTMMCVLASSMVLHHFFHVFILPCCVVPIILRICLDSRTAFVFHCGTIVLISLTLSVPYDFVLIELIAGMVAILNLKELTQRSQIISVATLVTLSMCVFYCGYQFATGAEIKDIGLRTLMYFAINGFLLLFTYPLVWVIEKGFGFVSDVTLVELSNTNNPLLRRLSEDAPGTFQHSMQVANLAADVAKKIGGRVQLVRTAALYHDIGKIEHPVFFTENQIDGRSPHDRLDEKSSAEIIISHVKKGIALAEKYRLPKLIHNFIASHHGKSKTKYFLITYKNNHPDEVVDESLFQYPGPNPSTKEEAILMMADSVEAASRSLETYSEETINELVDKIIDGQVAEGYFKECDITFKDISDAKEVFKTRLESLYHTRISYPELKQS